MPDEVIAHGGPFLFVTPTHRANSEIRPHRGQGPGYARPADPDPTLRATMRPPPPTPQWPHSTAATSSSRQRPGSTAGSHDDRRVSADIALATSHAPCQAPWTSAIGLVIISRRDRPALRPAGPWADRWDGRTGSTHHNAPSMAADRRRRPMPGVVAPGPGRWRRRVPPLTTSPHLRSVVDRGGHRSRSAHPSQRSCRGRPESRHAQGAGNRCGRPLGRVR
jgi:hypothetical protein